MIIYNVSFYTVFTFLPTYFSRTLGFSKLDAFISATIASVVALILILPLGALSDRIGRRPLLLAASLGFAVFTYPLFLLLNSGSIGYNVSVAAFGGTAPYIATFLVARTGNELAPAFYVVAAAVVTFATVLTMRETARLPLRKIVAV